MNNQDIAWQYAEGIFAAAMERWVDHLSAVARQLDGDQALQQTLNDPGVDPGRKRETLARIVPKEAGVEVLNFLSVLAQADDLGRLRQVIDALQMIAARGGIRPTVAEITSAVPLTDSEKAEIRDKLSARFGSDLEFRFDVDPDIIGGLVIRVGDKLIDASVASRLGELRQSLGITGD
ncbi:MAG TPA: ATP synthase F1 subunit delta [Anaerolineae bacterium]|nr:ATP synthase F1 subunit delta [Anaerolineae bacterium]HIQ05005.1 ATP synthase F1 subunit delta [Anaerolineae bacterium]